MDTRREEYRVPTFPNGDSLEMICNELQRGINEVAVGNMAIAKALLETLHGRIVKTAAAYAAGVKADRERTSGWIPVGERLPEAHVNVLCYTKGGGIVRDRYDGITLSDGTHQFHGDREEWRFDVTHWMPLPPPPFTTPNDQER